MKKRCRLWGAVTGAKGIALVMAIIMVLCLLPISNKGNGRIVMADAAHKTIYFSTRNMIESGWDPDMSVWVHAWNTLDNTSESIMMNRTGYKDDGYDILSCEISSASDRFMFVNTGQTSGNSIIWTDVTDAHKTTDLGWINTDEGVRFTNYVAEDPKTDEWTEEGKQIELSENAVYAYYLDVTSYKETQYRGATAKEVSVDPEHVQPAEFSLDVGLVSLHVGSSTKIPYTLLPKGSSDVTWISEDSSIATVDASGKVEGVSEGNTRVRAYCNKDESLTAECAVMVRNQTVLYYLTAKGSDAYAYFYNSETDHYSENGQVHIAMTKLPAEYYAMDTGSGSQAIANYDLYRITVPENEELDPYAYVVFTDSQGWTGKDPSVNGYKTTPDYAANGYINGGQCVTVSPKTIDSISITPDEGAIAPNQRLQLHAVGNYSDGSSEDVTCIGVKWYSSDTSIAAVSQMGLVSSLKEGRVTITAKSVQDGAITATATVYVENAEVTGFTISPEQVKTVPGASTQLSIVPTPENVDTSQLSLNWEVEDSGIAAVDSKGKVTAKAAGTTTVTASYTNQAGEVLSASTEVDVVGLANGIFYYAGMSKLASGDGNINYCIPNSSGIIYAHAWNSSSDYADFKFTNLGEISGDGITYQDGDIYYCLDENLKNYSHILFQNKTTVPAGAYYGQRTYDLDIPEDGSMSNPCFYAGTQNPSTYDKDGFRAGYWAPLFTTYDAQNIKTSSEDDTDHTVVAVNKGTIPKTDTQQGNKKITYLTSTLYDYYSDYELNGNEVSTDKNTANMNTQRNWVTFGEFNQALSDYYRSISGGSGAWESLAPIYTGHFQPSNMGTPFSNVAGQLNLYGWNENYQKFIATENSQYDVSGNNNQYANAAQGLVAQTLTGFQNGILGTGTLLTNDSSGKLPHFDEEFLTGSNSKNAILGQVFKDVQFPFIQQNDTYYDDVAYYTFDSAQQSLYYRTDENTGVGYLEDVGKDDSSKNVNATSMTGGVSSTYGYFPFNEDSTSGNARTYDYGFGTKLEFNFKLEKNGDVDSISSKAQNGKAPTIFKFSGDDDVWVYIDGKLVLDLGGSHGQVQGAINFSNDLCGVAVYPSTVQGKNVSLQVAQNSIAVSGIKASAGTTQSVNLSQLNLQDGKTHTLTMYYMERGMWESNMMVQFNMQIEKNINVQKVWQDEREKELPAGKKHTTYAAVTRRLGNDSTEEFVNLTESDEIDGSQYLIRLDSSNDWKATYKVEDYQNGTQDDDHAYTYYVYEVKQDSGGNPIIGNDGKPEIYRNEDTVNIGKDSYTVSGSGLISGTTGIITNQLISSKFNLNIRKIWRNEFGNDVTANHTEDVNVLLKRYVETDGQVTGVQYYQLLDGQQEWTEEKESATKIPLSDSSDYKWSIDNLARYQDVAETLPYHYTLIEDGVDSSDDVESGSVSRRKIVIGDNEYVVTEESIDASNISRDTLTVTNKLIGKYSLPMTGGKGVIPTNSILGGLALMSIFLLWKKSKEGRKKMRSS